MSRAKDAPEAAAPSIAAMGAAINGYETIALASWATGLSTQSRRQRTVGTAINTSLAESFLANSGIATNNSDAQISSELYYSPPAYCAMSLHGIRTGTSLNHAPLPPSLPLSLTLDQSIRNRRSSRSFTGDSLPVEMLATLLRTGAGITGKMVVPLEGQDQSVNLKLRAAPSAGGLCPIDLWVIAQNVQNLPKGIYSYAACEDSLSLRFGADVAETAIKSFVVDRNQLTIDRSSIIILYVAFPTRTLSKYGNRGLRFLFQEVGAMAQNINLASATLGVGTVECSAFVERDLSRLLKLRSLQGQVVHSHIIGVKD